MNAIDNTTNKTRKEICVSTKKIYDRRLKSLAITDYTNIDEVNQRIDKVKKLGTRKISCKALIYYYNSQFTPITSSDEILELLHEHINTSSTILSSSNSSNSSI